MKTTAIAMALATGALLISSCAGPGATTESSPAAASAAGHDAPQPSRSASSSAPASTLTKGTDTASRLDGTWTTGEMTVGEVTAHLRAAKLAKWASGFMQVDHHQDEAETVAYTVKLAGGRSSLFAEVNGNAPTRYDHGLFRVEGDRLIGYTEDQSCQGVFKYTLTGNTLRLSMLSDTCPKIEGLPDEVFARAYYETRPWTKVNP